MSATREVGRRQFSFRARWAWIPPRSPSASVAPDRFHGAGVHCLERGFFLLRGLGLVVDDVEQCGFFHAYQKQRPEVRITVASAWGARIRERLLEGDLDIGLLCLPGRLESGLRVTHRFKDAFVVIAPPQWNHRVDSLRDAPWSVLGGNGSTATLVRAWLDERQLAPSPAMVLDSFDLVINLVSQGMGVSVVPRRALALYRRNRPVTVLEIEGERLVRELAVVVRKDRKPSEHVEDFIESVLF